MIPAGQIFVIGDSHIGLSEGSETPILAWLDRLVALQPRALYLNGDLFHYLIADPKFYISSVENVFARFREMRDGGIPIHYVEGNRDFFLRGSFAERAVSDVAIEFAVQAGDRKYLIVHGDMINDRDMPYRFWRFASKNALSRFALKLVPKRAARALVNAVEQHLSETNFKHKTRLPTERMEAYGRKRGGEGFTHVVFGHFHHKLVLPGPTTVIVLPAWYETGEAMAIDPDSGSFDWVTV
ncbi:MAG: UDP-2,3-diacylglucosamine diphosphatase [Acidobacteriota bacterium]|nr:UDP-2,3-diacylglucosamine diphosphatase [Acidobacteriota bacterium]